MKKLSLVVVLLTGLLTTARAEDWVVLRKPPEVGESAPAGISVDSSSIEIPTSGIRRARVKVDFLSRRLGFEKFEGNPLSFTIWTVLYNCDKKVHQDAAMENHWFDGSVQTLDLSKSRWYPKSENSAVDPSFDFVCAWKPTHIRGTL